GPAALVSGAVFLAYPTVQGHLFGSHLGMIALWGIPLYLDALLTLRRRATVGVYARAVLFFVMSMLGSTMLLVFVLAPLTVLILLRWLMMREWVALRRNMIAVLMGGAVAAIFVVPAVIEQLTSPAAVQPEGIVRFSADLLAFASPSFLRPYAPPWSSTVIGTNLVEGYGYIGLVAGIMACSGMWRVQAARPWAWTALAAYVLSLGPILKLFDDPVTLMVDGRATFIPMPFAFLHSLPIIEATRTPARFNLAVGLCVAVIVGYGLAWLGARRWRWVGAVVLIGLVLADYQLSPGRFPTVPAAIPAEITALRDDASIEAVMALPHDNLLVSKAAMYLQTGHHKPMIGGFVSRETPISFAKREVLQQTLDPALFHEAGVDAIFLFREWDTDLNATVYDALGTPFYEDARLAAFRVPEASAPASFTTVTDDPHTIHLYTPTATWADIDGIIAGGNTDYE
ncbi:MAG: hypothetical protein AAF125_23575, partial [Chloroflexota bacterium]